MNREIQDWELTAFALGELPADRASQIEQAIAADPALAGELAMVAETIGQVTQALRATPATTPSTPPMTIPSSLEAKSSALATRRSRGSRQAARNQLADWTPTGDAGCYRGLLCRCRFSCPSMDYSVGMDGTCRPRAN